MSKPFDPFGRSDRTIIMPNPGGRRAEPAPQPSPPQAPGPGAPPPPSHFPPPPPPPPQRAAPVAPSSQPAFAPASYGAVPGAPSTGEDAWAFPQPAAPPPPLTAAERQRALVLKRDVVVAPNENPFLRAGGPLLLLLGRLRVQLSRASFANLMEQVAATIEDFERDTRTAGISAEQTRVAKYIVCATADDIVQNIPTDDRHVWTQYSMLSRFFGERIGGVRFFEELERAKVDPVGNYYLLELMHACLALGFRGIHGTSAGGPAALQTIQRNLYELLRRTRQPNREISPRWQGQAIAAAISRFQVPVWAVASVVGVLLLGLFFILRMLLAGGAEAAATAMVTVHPIGEVGIQRRIYTPPPPPPPPPPQSQVARFRGVLQAEVASGNISVAETGNQVVIRIAAALFAPGQADVKPEFAALIHRLTALLDKEPGALKVVGHTDSQPIKNVRFPSNFHLSQERAKAVAGLMKAKLTRPERIEVEGKGADVPIAPNDTVEGRAKNRRVEILIPRSA
ncbi:type VI secretion system protein TssL, long form [Enterovirga aerilata]|uniref:Type VI secretion system protein TssL n=1 Tax=Enterovirga aerilata TaxID=2730920 RepID=A0A849IEW9_9HYPH|nr:type VI secretion system protein TssL, long form [Enterovirga sp. DB1703]NNM74650.1 type VI secretion system protein TssL [Enterovirga sp. DB1703]